MSVNAQATTTLDRGVTWLPGPDLTRRLIGEFYLVMAGLNLGIVIADASTYRHFADAALFGFVRTGWTSIVMEQPGVWIGVLAAGEIAIGLAFLGGKRWAIPAYAAVLVFHVLLVLIGWGFLIWSGPVLVLMTLAARRELGTRATR